MNQLRWLLRAKRWAQNPPSPKRVKFVFAIIAACIALVVVEKTIGLPDWMQVERQTKIRIQH
ncbi:MULTISPECIES: hypothetical protein [Celeribacter]|uniref:Uncharacterized protein n=1 Tax=Celeribacter halophilus TaxID=576117 RepID=A0AAW7XU83_9RHOB|nr:hypothetical protein [Celeribacter halophilus]MDO6457963.1 hypothetical protein [Celeribacter halophilus]MDO6722524.1 hypothetical protein [Celeribacter halophilus]